MTQALVQDVVTEVMRRLEDRLRPAPVPAAPAKPRVSVESGRYGVFSKVDDAVAAAEDAQKKLLKLSLDERDQIVKLVKSMAKANARAWGELEFAETKI